MKRTLRRQKRKLVHWLLLAPFILSSMVAQGIMPAKAQNGFITLIICTGDSLAEIVVDPITMEPVESGDDGDGSGANSCAWASMHHEPGPLLLVSLSQPLTLSGEQLSSTCTAILEFARATGLPPATGPPATI
ncbi:hypothetical protein [Notoacmeibacter ruber]|uniref:DUF2946 domain-containing protein n=1 Tax=Notoacmeibacter ruber TaxID=2670375 RepID=A0A3L7J8T8_9HYPH|nr:hypothetical protein [Notoacmeibacter ruber]RLQ87036.1 hypothetical protein D8780_01230 [Notoacmeibacter ruber]